MPITPKLFATPSLEVAVNPLQSRELVGARAEPSRVAMARDRKKMHFLRPFRIASRWLQRTIAGTGLLLLASCGSPPIGPTVALLWYPVGFMTKVEMHQEVGEHGLVSAGIGWNQADRGDNGEHDDEVGGGPGAVFGYRHYLGERYDGFFLTGNVDVWWMDIDWEDFGPPLRTGNTDITVLQPYVGAGYRFELGEQMMLEVAAGLGAEINVSTDGEDVGEGAILLIGATLLY